MTEGNTVSPLNKVAERYSLKSSPISNAKNPTVQQDNREQQDKTTFSQKYPQPKAPAETLHIVSGSVTESKLLQAQSICKVKVQLKGIRDHPTAIALSESSRVRGINLENGLYNNHNGKSEVFVSNTLHTDIFLKEGTELGRFQVSKTVDVVNNYQFSNENKQTAPVYALKESIHKDENIKQHLAPTTRPDLERDLLNLLILHQTAVALPGDALGKTTLLQHEIKLKPGRQPIYVPAYR